MSIKKLIALILIVSIGLLGACTTSSGDHADDQESEATFIGTIEELNDEMALVSIKKGDILKSGSLVDVNLSVANGTTFQIGDKIKVGYDGYVREKHPLGIHTTFVELVN
ncbi:hypothetical protein G4V62_10780 [Bacillaceae bacterium SIJ1]|uniref:hypothetical protein n=1 Tax=Litoribacterium kuwaitense TaxID=1398745 RepID=UPI0013ED0C7F|nr:hypothetical protein [Litoribacterium kuwaitense]NGP45416.1 hypothetical protein [Litoribacterium kuwaitense]